MTLILIKFIICPLCEKGFSNARVKSKILRKLSLDFIFGQGSCLISDFTRSNSNKAILLQFHRRISIGNFNNNFTFCEAEFLSFFVAFHDWLAASF